jgi:hypothetical protein
MPPTIPPLAIRQAEALISKPSNELRQLAGRQGLEAQQGAPGPQGGVGPGGAKGKEGPPNKGFTFTEGAPSAEWHIVHKQKKYPSVTVIDTANDEVQGITEYLNEEELNIIFSAPVTGVAYLN